MPRLLLVQSSPNGHNSITRELSTKFVDLWVSNHSNVDVETLDLVADPLPHFGPLILGAFATPSDQRTPEMQARIDLSDRLIRQLEEANVLVIGAPMINFTIPTQLKAWFDHVTIAGRTFQYSAPGIAKGMLFGKKTFVVEARGGDYADGPASQFDFQEPLLRILLGFLGVFDVTFIRAEGMRQRVEDVPMILRNAELVISRLAA